MGYLYGLMAAVQFLTRLPIRLDRAVPHSHLVPWFPVAGAAIGAMVGITGALAALVVSPLAAAAVAIVVGMLITGAFHEDGLGDVADAFGGGWTPEQRLAILKDSRHGTYGVAAIVSSVLLRTVLAADLETPAALGVGLFVSHVLARTVAVGAMAVFPLAVESGLGAEAAKAVSDRAIVLSGLSGLTLAGLALAGLSMGWWTFAAAGAALFGAWATGRLAVSKIGGLAGDVLGAIEQVAECLVLLVLAAAVT